MSQMGYIQATSPRKYFNSVILDGLEERRELRSKRPEALKAPMDVENRPNTPLATS